MQTPAPFTHPEAFSVAFAAGLESILAQQTLGAFVLVCANASNQAELHSALQAPLAREFTTLARGLRDQALTVGNAEDLRVFEQLAAVGLQNLSQTERRESGVWQLQYNMMRAFRPQRHAAQVPEHLLQAFQSDGFHFNKPFMVKELLWEGRWQGHSLAAYYNKFPFADYHLLWVPDRERGMPQYLSADYHQLMSELVRAFSAQLPGFAMGYNALGALASVNHLHFQSYVGAALPITSHRWRHHGGDEPYPLCCEVFDTATAAWRYIEHLHRDNQPYNLLYTAAHIYVVPRRRQGSYVQPVWSPGLAWREVCGDVITTSEGHYRGLQAAEIAAALAQLRMD